MTAPFAFGVSAFGVDAFGAIVWDFSQSQMTFDNVKYLFDGTFPGVSPPPVVAPNIMPSVVGIEYLEVILILQQQNIFVPASLGYFGTYPIAVIWQQSAFPPGTVLAQVPQPGTYVPPNGSVTLTVSEFPISVAFP